MTTSTEKPILIDKDELTLLLIEAVFSRTRPEGATIEEALEGVDPNMVEHFRRGAYAAMRYMAEKMDLDLKRVSAAATGVQ